MQPINSRNSILVFLLVVGALSLLPFLGLTDYHTKGEPRESLVAVSMLNNGNWILPVNSGGDIAYKPLLFHWAVAACSILQSAVTEASSRLPSALSVLVLTLVCFLFFAKRIRNDVAFLSMLLFLTFFEVHRAGMASRVDMILTLFMVWGALQLYKWQENGLRGIPFWGVLFLGLGTLAKGPIALLLPCGAMGLFLLLRRVTLWRAFWKLSLVAVASCLLPAVWYYLAYLQGGDAFLNLVLEENFGRFMGKMSYESHEQNVLYYLYITLAGLLPWTLLLLLGLTGIRLHKNKESFKIRCLNFKDKLLSLPPAKLYSLVFLVVVTLFYCIPKSKRSVYLLPIYPFLALFIAEFILYFVQKKPNLFRLFGKVIAILTAIVWVVFILLWSRIIPDNLSGLASIQPMLDALQRVRVNFISLFYTLLPVITLYFVFRYRKGVAKNNRYLYAVVALVFTLQSFLDAVILPPVLNQKSTKSFAHEVVQTVPQGAIYYYTGTDLIRFYIMNFYAGDRIVSFEEYFPQTGYLLIAKKGFPAFSRKYQDRYSFEPVLISDKKSPDVRDIVQLFRFKAI